MVSFDINKIKVGDSLPELIIRPITQSTLSKYAEASGDHNPIHLDFEFAQKAGLPNVIAHGMLIMSYLAQAITNHIDQCNIKEYGVKFSSMTNIGDSLTCSVLVTQVSQIDSERQLKLKLLVSNQHNDEKLVGYANIVSY